MKTTEAQKRAIDKYQKANIRRYVVKLNKNTDGDMIAYLEGKQAQTAFKNGLKAIMAIKNYGIQYVKKHESFLRIERFDTYAELQKRVREIEDDVDMLFINQERRK